MDRLTQIKILFWYLLSITNRFLKSIYLRLVSNLIGVVSDKFYVGLSGDKSSRIVNVARQYTFQHEDLYFSSGAIHVDRKGKTEIKTENITYGFRYLFENLSDDNSLLLDDLVKYIPFDRLIIDYVKDDKIVKKIIEHSMLNYSYIDLDFHSTVIPFGRIEF